MKQKKTDVIAFDIDGTLADISHRLHFIEGSKKDWDSFYANMADDKPIQGMVDICNALWAAGHPIVFITGRPEKYRELTVDWLSKQFMPLFKYLVDINVALHMRKDGDRRPDVEVKKEIYEDLKAKGVDVVMAFEDRSRVVQMWRDAGVRCLQVADGNY